MSMDARMISKFNKQARDIQQRMVALETRVKTGRLKRSISFKYVDGSYIFKSVSYGQFQDEGTYGRKQQTKVSRGVWNPPYRPNGRGRAQIGIRPLHFTKPIEDVNLESVKSIITPFLVKDARDKIKKIVAESSRIQKITITK